MTLRPPFPAELLERLPTPSLLVDVAAVERNIERAADFFSEARAKLRPHFKAHKCSRLMERQLAGGACVGVTCATAWEAEVLAEAGFTDVLLANQVADPVGLASLARAAEHADLSVAVDSYAHIDALQVTAQRAQVVLGVLIEIDVGMGRSGLEPDSDELPRLAAAVDAAPALRLHGLQGYEGHAVLKEDRGERRAQVARAAEILARERERLERSGFRCSVVSGGGTGTYDLAVDAGVLDEIQAGSYVLMDARYGALDLPFEHALYCASTVISRRREDAAVLNAGWKALSAEYGMPRALERGLDVLKLSDEHARVAVAPDTPLAIGDCVLLIPAHVDPTVNLHDVLFAWRPEGGLESWPVDGRRRLATSSVV